jgi:hypothetical protein
MVQDDVRLGAPNVRGGGWRGAKFVGTERSRGRRRVIGGGWRGEQAPQGQAPKEQPRKEPARQERAAQERGPRAKRQRGSEVFCGSFALLRIVAPEKRNESADAYEPD